MEIGLNASSALSASAELLVYTIYITYVFNKYFGQCCDTVG